MNNLQEWAKKGVDIESVTKKTNLIFILTDVIESISLEIKEELKVRECFKQEVKQHLNNIELHSKRLVRIVDRTVDMNEGCLFGEDADKLKDELYKLCKL